MEKRIEYGHSPRAGVLNGMRKMAAIVRATHGPTGGNVMMDEGTVYPLISKDGATVGNHVDFADPYERMGIQLIKGTIDKVDAQAGDGTTTTTIYTYELAERCEHLASLGLNVHEVRKGMQKASDMAESYLRGKAIPITIKDIDAVAKLSSNGSEEISNLLVEAFNSIGENGVVALADSYRRDGTSYVDVSQGIKWPNGIAASCFETDEATNECRLQMPYILVYGVPVDSLEAIEPILQQTRGQNLAIIAPYFDSAIFERCAGEGVACIMGPGHSLDKNRLLEELRDVAIAVDTKVIPDLASTSKFIKSLEDLGRAELIVSKLDSTIITQLEEITPEHAKRYEEYVNGLCKLLDENDELSIARVENLKDRIARLSGGIATIHVGAPTVTEKEEKVASITDAMNSVKSALNNGVLPGGGTAMLKTAVYLESNIPEGLSPEAIEGYKAVCQTLRIPAKNLVESLKPEDYQMIVQDIARESDFNVGYNLLTEKKEDLVKAKIIDAAAIEYYVVHYAASTVGSFITTKGFITFAKDNVSYDYNDRAAVDKLEGMYGK